MEGELKRGKEVSVGQCSRRRKRREGAVHEVDTGRERERGASIRHGRSDRKVSRVVGQVDDIRVYSYRGKARKRAYWCIRRAHLSGEGSSRACRSARSSDG